VLGKALPWKPLIFALQAKVYLHGENPPGKHLPRSLQGHF
jgi:hypothetical protein